MNRTVTKVMELGESLDLARKVIITSIGGVSRMAVLGGTAGALAAGAAISVAVSPHDQMIISGMVSGLGSKLLFIEAVEGATKLPGVLSLGNAWEEYSHAAWEIFNANMPLAVTHTALVGAAAIMGGLRLSNDAFSSFLEKMHVRGAKRVDHDKLIELAYTKPIVKDGDKLSPYHIAGVPLTWAQTLQCIVLNGNMGSGKSVQNKQLLNQGRAEGIDMLVLCVAGDYIAAYYDPANPYHVMVHPYDARSVAINIFAELGDPSEERMRTNCTNFFNTLIPEGPKANPFYLNVQRQLATETTIAIYKAKGDQAVTPDLMAAFNLPIPALAAMLADSELANSFSDKKSVESIMGAMLGLKSQLRVLHVASGGTRQFSISQWARSLAVPLTEREPYTVFIATSTNTIGESRMLLTALIDVAIRELMSLPVHRHAPRVIVSLDEAQKLGNVSQMPTLLTEGRKFGIMTILAFQAQSQFEHIYEQAMASTLLSQLQTRVIYRTADDIAELMSKSFGEEEAYESDLNMTSTAGESRDSTGRSRKKTPRPVVLPSEITTMDDLYAFLKLPGALPVAKIKSDYRGLLPEVQPGFIPKIGVRIEAPSE